MVLIIDANRANDFGKQMSGHAPEILKRTSNRSIKIVVGGRLLDELSKTLLRPILVEWIRSGIATVISKKLISVEMIVIQTTGCRSNDSHVLALARASGARLIYTDDQNLINDLKNKSLIDPPGKAVKSRTPAKPARILFNTYGN